jgi:hypothetical protein
MAKRRDFKKTVEYLSGELMTGTLLCSLQPKADQIKLREMMTRICDMSDEYRRRIQNPPVTADKQPVKQYYKKLREDFNAEVDKIYEELGLLN